MRRTRTTARLVASAGLVAGSLVAVGTGMALTGPVAGAEEAADTTLVQESFTGDEAPGWHAFGEACLTGSGEGGDEGPIERRSSDEPTDPSLPDVVDEPEVCNGSFIEFRSRSRSAERNGDGYLQLTDNDFSETGGVIYGDDFSNSRTVVVTFDQFQWGAGGDNGGHGITMFLADGGAGLPYSTGAQGASLGYSPGSGDVFFPAARREARGQDDGPLVPGVKGAFLGVGLDANGEFSSSDADGVNCSDGGEGGLEGAPGTEPDAVVLRGGAGQGPSDVDGEFSPGSNFSGYCFVANGAVDTPWHADSLDDALRTVRVTVGPGRSGNGPSVKVEVDPDGAAASGGGSAGYGTAMQTDFPEAAPDSYRVGFTASNGAPDFNLRRSSRALAAGGVIDHHYIRNVSVTTPRRTNQNPPAPDPTDPDPQPAVIPTTTDLTVTKDGMSATVTPPEGVEPPSGEVVLSADGEELDTVELEMTDGVATVTSDETVPPGEDVDFTAEYLGEGDYQPSEDLYERVDPTITARVITDEEPNEAGWYSDPLRIAFSCTRGSAPIIGGCPDRVYRKNTHPRKFFERSIAARDGGGATVVVPIKVDHRGPVITVRRAKGSPYPRDARPIRCSAFDGRSGVKRECWVEYGEFETLANGRMRRHFTVRATDVAGNVSVRRLTFWIERDRG